MRANRVADPKTVGVRICIEVKRYGIPDTRDVLRVAREVEKKLGRVTQIKMQSDFGETIWGDLNLELLLREG